MFHMTLQAFNSLIKENRMSREFRERYRDVLNAVDELRPGFWTAMADELRRMFEGCVMTRGAVVREFPAQRDAEVQAVATIRDAATEPAVEAACGVAVQAGPVGPEPDSTSTEDWEAPIMESPWDSPRERGISPASSEWPRPPARLPSPDDSDPPEGCWNCGSSIYFARECPRERRGLLFPVRHPGIHRANLPTLPPRMVGPRTVHPRQKPPGT